MAKLEILAASAGILGIISFSSLLHKIFNTYNTTSLPWTWVISNITAQSLMLAYGVVNDLPGITWPSVAFVLGLFYIVIIKTFHETHDEYNKSIGIKEVQENPVFDKEL
jgi:uncharacterized protein with PQ loop repeat